VEVGAPLDCAATKGVNNNDMSTALQTVVADVMASMGSESLRAEV
jgi:hypothetical protein